MTEPAGSPRPERDDGAADEWIDGLLPDELDWRAFVVRHPLASLALAGLGGFLIGRTRGEGIVDTVSRAAAEAVEASVDAWVEQYR